MRNRGIELAARRRAFDRRLQVAIVGDDAEASGARHPEPGAARLQVAPAEDARIVLPPVERRGRPLVKFIAVAGEDQPIAGVVFPGKDEQAHGQDCRARGLSEACGMNDD